jgi:uncharacterized protein (DUF983 family)
MKSLIRIRREQEAVCPRCKSPDYKMKFFKGKLSFLKPEIRCNSCGNWWTCGKDGGIYAKLLSREKKIKGEIKSFLEKNR